MTQTSFVDYPVSPLLQEDLTPREFLELYKAAAGVIKETKVIPPKLGEPGFGRIRVRYRYPFYRQQFSKTNKNGERRATLTR